MKEMSLRQMLIERILFAHDAHDLSVLYMVTEAELENMSDVDLLELYDEVNYEVYQ